MGASAHRGGRALEGVPIGGDQPRDQLLAAPGVRLDQHRGGIPRIARKGHAGSAGLDESLHEYRDHRRTLGAVCGLALLVQVVRVGTIWMLVQALQLEVPVWEIFAAGPVLFAALILPVSLNGIGVREAVFVSFLRDSTTAEQAITAAGGPKRVADWEDVRIYRTGPGANARS